MWQDCMNGKSTSVSSAKLPVTSPRVIELCGEFSGSTGETGTMKNAHPIITATTSSPVSPDSSSSNEPAEPVIRLKLDKPLHWEWELTTSADALPVIQLLDKDGRLLVETSGRTAQRARGSFRDGLKSHEEFPEAGDSGRSSSRPISSGSFSSSTTTPSYPLPLQGNRNIDGFSTKFGGCEFGYRPRKSRSEVSVKERDRKARKRHSSGTDSALAKRPEDANSKGAPKRYSAGDYLRQQIIDDLRSRSTLGRNPDDIAKDRYKKVKAYLRSQSDGLANFVEIPEQYGLSTKQQSVAQGIQESDARNHETDKELTGLPEDHSEQGAKERSCTRTPSNLSLGNSLSRESAESSGDLMSKTSEMSRLKSKPSGEDLARVKAFLQEKIQRKMQQDRSRSLARCTDASEIPGCEIKKRYSEYRHAENPRSYRTRKVRSETSIVRQPSEVQEKEVRVERQKSKNGRDACSEESPGQRITTSYRRSRSDAIIEAGEPRGRSESRRQGSQVRRKSSSLEKRKLYRKTKSDLLLGQASGVATSFESDKDFENPVRRIRSQDNVEESWREYKERKKHERLHRESEVTEEDFMSKPRWKDLQGELCSFKNCKVCQNSRNCVNPLQPELPNTCEPSSIDRSIGNTRGIISNDSSSDRPGTSLQENYVVVDKRPKSQNTPVIARIQVKNHGSPSISGTSAGDCGYNSIPKRAFKDFSDLCAHSNVKKSDTFKIVDGSEQLDGIGDRSDSKENLEHVDGGSEENFEGPSGESTLANKSNEDIARDYFKRVYELLKKRQEEARSVAEGRRLPPGYDDSSSSNYAHEQEARSRRQRRRRKEKSPQDPKDVSVTKRASTSVRHDGDSTGIPGEEVVTVAPASGGQEWNRSEAGNRRRGCRSQPQPQVSATAGKRASTTSSSSSSALQRKANAKGETEDYFDWPNKENTPGNAVNNNGLEHPKQQEAEAGEESTMGSNLSRHNGKGLNGRRTQSSGNLCEPKGKLNSMGKILVPCSSGQRERYKFCGSLPNHLDDKDVLDDDPRENNNIMSDAISGSLGGTLPHKKRSLGVHFSDGGPTGTLDLVKHRSQDSLDENDPWRYQQSDLDLVRCRHGNLDSVRRNRSTDAVSSGGGGGVEGGRRYGRGMSLEERCQRNSDLDLVGTLPKRKQQDARGAGKAVESNTTSSSSSQPSTAPDASNEPDDDLLMKIVHKPDCELLRHRQQFAKTIDLQLSKLTSGEPQDQGYASERSPEDEHPPSLPGQPFPNITPESTFRVTLQKSSRGLGLSVSGGGTAGPVRVKRLFPQQPAALSNKLQPGDILLAANGIPLTGLTNYEALEVLRTTPSTVELVVCRLPGDSNVTPPGAPPPPPARREPPPPLRILNPLPPLQIEPCGEFDIEMTKVGGSLGFTLRKADSSALGHYVRALVREPALSDGRIRPGDKIVAVDGAPLSPMSHEEAVQLLRQCGPTVRLRLYRDLAQTPVSALSPTEPDHPLRPPRTSLRQEAVDMLCDLAVRKLSPGTSSGSSCKQSPGTSCNSPRRHRRLATRTPTMDVEQESVGVQTMSTGSLPETSDSDQCSIRTQITNSQPNTPGTDIIDPPPLYDVCDSSDSSKTLARPSFLDLSAPQGKPRFQFCSVDSDECRTDATSCEEDQRGTRDTGYSAREANALSGDDQDNDLPSEPASMPPILSSGTSATTFSYKNPAYQSANPACGASIDSAPKSKVTHSSDQDIPGKILGADDPGGSKGLLKWKGVMFAPDDDGVDKSAENEEQAGKDTTDSAVPTEGLEQGTEVFTIELTRRWNSRLGFSLQPDGNRTVISVVHPDSVAAKDGRLKQGDVLLRVSDENVENMSTAEIIDLLRKIRGSIGITVMRRVKRENAT